MVVGDVPYSLVCTGILNDAVAGTAMRAEALLWRGDIKSDEIIIPESLYFPDPGFLGQFGYIVAYFHGHFSSFLFFVLTNKKVTQDQLE